MSLLADALQPSIRSEFISISGRLHISVLSDIIIAPKVGYDLNFHQPTNSILLDFRDAQVIIAAFAADCCRFATASFQTIASLSDDILNRDQVAWSLIRLYYSAFYSGHAILRLFGESYSYFDRQHVSKINKLGKAIGTPPPFKIDSGLYKCLLKIGTAELECNMVKGQVSGIHELFWEVFGNTIETKAKEVLTGSLIKEDAQSVYVQLDNLIKNLQKDGSYKRLSSFRNELQYKHKHEVWFPNNPRMKDKEFLSKLIKNWTKDPMKIDLSNTQSELEIFILSCVFIVSSCRTLLERIAERSHAGKKCFVTLGPTVFLKDRLIYE